MRTVDEKMYSLMHRDEPVCAITIDTVSGAIHRVSKPVNPELLPLGGCIDSAMLKKWWQRRYGTDLRFGQFHVLAEPKDA